MTYQLIANSTNILKTDDSGGISYIPCDALNRDWITYQIWLAAGNTPTPAASS